LNDVAEEYLWAAPEELERLPIEPYTWNVIREFRKKKGVL